MKKPPSLATAMTPFPYAVDHNASLEFAQQLMQQHDVRHLPVTEEHGLVGLITERDMRSVERQHSGLSAKRELTVNDAYIADPYIVDLHESLDNVLMTMAERHIGSAIVTKSGKLVGMFTAVDACRCFGEFLREHFPHAEGDDDVA
ncbi:MAG: CBS domain-containing protein [Gammaproteobacteria bacterium]|nr:MAG: CBS domain-containing protein [Gammaproteobacteria bacterium]